MAIIALITEAKVGRFVENIGTKRYGDGIAEEGTKRDPALKRGAQNEKPHRERRGVVEGFMVAMA
jgi:hypothetical protein